MYGPEILWRECLWWTTHFLHPNLNETDVEKEKVVFVKGRICKVTDLAFCSHFYYSGWWLWERDVFLNWNHGSLEWHLKKIRHECKKEWESCVDSPVDFHVSHLFFKLPCDDWSRFRSQERVMVRENYFCNFVCPFLFPVILEFWSHCVLSTK